MFKRLFIQNFLIDFYHFICRKINFDSFFMIFQKKSEDVVHVSSEEAEISAIPHLMASESTDASYAADNDTSIVTLNTVSNLLHYLGGFFLVIPTFICKLCAFRPSFYIIFMIMRVLYHC